jgi:hypothetical protein
MCFLHALGTRVTLLDMFLAISFKLVCSQIFVFINAIKKRI